MANDTDDTIAHAAHQWCLKQASDLIEALVVIDPETGEEARCYEPDPDEPGTYRATAAYARIKAQHGDHVHAGV